MEELLKRTEGFIQLTRIENYLMHEWSNSAINNASFPEWNAYFEAFRLIGQVRVNF